MKRIVSMTLTAALVLSMGVSAFAATPSKTVLDEVTPTVETSVETTTGGVIEISVADSRDTTEEGQAAATEAAAQTETVLANLSSEVDLVAETGAAEDEAVEVTAATTFTVGQNTLEEDAVVTVSMSSKVIEASYEEGETVTVVVSYPVVDEKGDPVLDADGKQVMAYESVKATVVGGKIEVRLTAAQIKKMGSKFTLVALKKTKQSTSSSTAA